MELQLVCNAELNLINSKTYKILHFLLDIREL
jgi:hypothetical protein